MLTVVRDNCCGPIQVVHQKAILIVSDECISGDVLWKSVAANCGLSPAINTDCTVIGLPQYGLSCDWFTSIWTELWLVYLNMDWAVIGSPHYKLSCDWFTSLWTELWLVHLTMDWAVIGSPHLWTELWLVHLTMDQDVIGSPHYELSCDWFTSLWAELWLVHLTMDQLRLLHLTVDRPHSVVTRIGSVTRDQKVPGSNPVWVGCCGVDIYQWCLTGLTKAWWCA